MPSTLANTQNYNENILEFALVKMIIYINTVLNKFGNDSNMKKNQK